MAANTRRTVHHLLSDPKDTKEICQVNATLNLGLEPEPEKIIKNIIGAAGASGMWTGD